MRSAKASASMPMTTLIISSIMEKPRARRGCGDEGRGVMWR
jgi:hypothetical protein